MSKTDYLRRRQKSVMFAALLLFALLLLMLQLWLFVASLENLLAGNYRVSVPAACASAGVFVVNLWMLRGVTSIMKLR